MPNAASDSLRLKMLDVIPDRHRQRVRRWGTRLLTLVIGQSAVQAVNCATGILLVRWMSVNDYAQYSVVLGFQTTLAMFVDLGFGNSIVSLAGQRGHDPDVVGAYVAAAKQVRMVLLVTLLPLTAIIFHLIGQRHGWELHVQGVLFSCVAAALYCEGWVGWFMAPLLIHQRIAQIYHTQSFVAVAKLLLCSVLRRGGALMAMTLAAANACGSALTGWHYRTAARPYVRVPARCDPEIRHEMYRFLAPQLPGIAFTALQGQFTLFLISFFGQSRNIAEVAALGRLGQVFILVGAVNATMVAPYFARVDTTLLWRRYTQVLGGALLLATLIMVLAVLFPGFLLKVLGSKYENLDREFIYMMAAGCISYVNGVMWSIHSARKWIFWWGGPLYIGMLTAVQIAFIAWVDLSTTLQVLYLTLATNCATSVVHGITARAGFMRESSLRTVPA